MTLKNNFFVIQCLFKLSEITTKTIYIDGTKIEAYASKYSFVWKKSTLKYKERLEENTLELIDEFNKYNNYLEILGKRNSFSKTDKETAFMRMKEDYMHNGQLKMQ